MKLVYIGMVFFASKNDMQFYDFNSVGYSFKRYSNFFYKKTEHSIPFFVKDLSLKSKVPV